MSRIGKKEKTDERVPPALTRVAQVSGGQRSTLRLATSGPFITW